MPLPNISVPQYVVNLPSDNTEITFRPFLVREQKLLLMAAESQEVEEIEKIITQLISDCVLTPNVAVGGLPSFDADWLLVNMRKNSVGKNIELNMKHSEENVGECKHVHPVNVNLDNLEIFRDEAHNPTVKLTDKIGVELRYPTQHELTEFNNDPINKSLDLIYACTKHVFDAEEVYTSFTKEEMKDFLEKLMFDPYQKIQEFFNTMPRVGVMVNWTCPKCEVEESTKIEGMEQLFIL